MNKTFTVFKYEFLKIVTRKSFLLLLILLPLVPSLLLGVFNLIGGKDNQSIQQIFMQAAMNRVPMGIVDQSGLIKEVPDWLSNGMLTPIRSEAAANAQVKAGKLDGYYLFKPDFLQTGQVLTIKPKVGLTDQISSSDSINQVIDYNLLGADQELFNKFTNPVTYNMVPVKETTDTRASDDIMTFMVPYVILLFFYMLILSSASMMLNSVSQEKENRTMELLLSSTKPIELYLGKLLALGLAAFLQMIVWLTVGVLLMRSLGQTFSLGAGAQIPLKVIVLAVPCFLLGYAIYGSLMAGLGALAPNLKEANQFSFIITLPLIFCMVVLGNLMSDPNGPMITFLSIFPLTSMIILPTRVAIVNVPWWQIALGLALLLVTAVFVVRAVANLFHAQTLLTGRKFKLNEFFQTLLKPEKV